MNRSPRVTECLAGRGVAPAQLGRLEGGELGADGRPERCALVRLQPDAQHVLDALHVDADGEMGGLVAHVPAVTDLDDDRVEEDHRIERLQRPLLPDQDLLADLVDDLRDRLVADLGADRGGEMVLDITRRHRAR